MARRATERRRGVPLLRTDDLTGAVWIPGDGKANPTDLTQSLAKGARTRGARIVEGVKADGRRRAQRPRQPGFAWTAGDERGTIALRIRRQLRRPVGARVRRARGRHRAAALGRAFLRRHRADRRRRRPTCPVIRDPDGFIYYKEEVGGLVMGGFEPVAKPWNVERIPDRFEFQLLPEDWDQFEVLMQNAMHRTPCLETAQIKLLLNGPESFTLDGNFLLGEAPELARLLRLRRLQLGRHRQCRRRGRLIAEWIVAGEPPFDVWDVDIRRFAPFHANRRHLADRTVETLGLHYAMRWPREELGHRAAAAPLAAVRPAGGEAARCSARSSTGSARTISCRRAPRSRRPRSTRRHGCRGCSTSSARAARTSSSSTRRRSPNSC